MHGDGTGDEDAADEFLKDWHRRNAAAAIDGHDANGVWRESLFAPWLKDALPVVIDANVLRNCVGPTAKRGTRMALTSVANARGTRVFCAAHVVDEFYEHHEEWAHGYGVTPEVYRTAFETEYRPLLRVVATDGIEEMLLPEERARLDVLRGRDLDDVPTATVAIAMGAMPITMDPAPWEAVYGERADTADLQGWLNRFMMAGDRAELEKFQTGVTAGVSGAVFGTGWAAVQLFRFSPVLFAAAGIGFAAIAVSIPRETYAERWNDLGAGFSRLNEAIFTPSARAEANLRAQLPPFPAWGDLINATARDAALARACLYRLARSRTTPALASEIAEHLPELAIGQTPPRIGTALRRFPAFFEVASRQWQVGRPVGFL
jgi:hypothetical protein